MVLCQCFRPKVPPTPELEEDFSFKQRKSEQYDLRAGTSSASGSFDTTSRHHARVPGTPVTTPPSLLRPSSPGRFSPSPRASRVGSVHLTFNQISKATQNFSKSCLIGSGDFGMVYKVELQDGLFVAVKRAKEKKIADSRNGFSNEVKLLSQIEHQNLVKLLGYIDEGNEQIIISEYVPNGTLREHLDGIDGRVLDFSQRLQIAIDIAHGLTYLHQYAEKTIIHRDVKSSNILLTEGLRAKVADFGFARAGPTGEQSHIMTNIRGTAGYMDPQYMQTGKLTTKTDVFSYGVLLLEIASGRRPLEPRQSLEERVTVRWAFKKYTKGKMREIMDPNLEEEVHGEVISKFLGLAFDCAAPNPGERPTMEEVVKRLWDIRKEYGRSRIG